MTGKYVGAGLQILDWGYRNSSGYVIGAAATLANGSDSAMVNADGADILSLQPADYRIVAVPGDDANVGTFIFPPDSSPQGSLELGTFNSALAVAGQGTKIWTDGDYEMVTIGPKEFSINALVLIANSRAQSRDSGAVGNPIYLVQIWPNVQAVPRFANGIQNATGMKWTHQLIANPSSKLPDGRALSLANQGATQAVGLQFASPYPVAMHTHISDGSDLTFTLGHVPVAANGTKVKATRNGTALVYTTDYTVSAVTGVVTLVAAGTAGDIVVVTYQYSPTGN